MEQIANRLAAYGRFRLLTGGSRTAPPRQQTLLATIEWSHALLAEPEQVLFRRLAVFAGGWTLEAAEAVAADESQRSEVEGQKHAHFRLPLSDILDTLTQLVNKSLVIAERRPGADTRFRMLETIRQYAQERLWAAGEAEALQQRHLDYYVALAERAEPELRGPQQVLWLDRVEAEHDNVRAALAGSVENDVVAGLRLAGALEWYWWIREHKQEGADWLNRLLPLEALQNSGSSRTVPHALVRGQALNVLARLCVTLQTGDIAWAVVSESLALHRALGEAGRQGLAYALYLSAGGSASKSALLEESFRLFQAVGDKFGMAEALSFQAAIAWNLEGDFTRARRLSEQAQALRREIGDEDGLATGWLVMGQFLFELEAWGQAAQGEAEALTLYRKLKNKWGIAYSLSTRAGALWALGEYDQARQHLEEAMLHTRHLGGHQQPVLVTFGLGSLALCQGHYAEAERYFSARVAEARAAGDWRTVKVGLLQLAEAVQAQGQLEAATNHYQEVIDLDRKHAALDLYETAQAFMGLGRVATAQGQAAEARALLKQALTHLRGTGARATLYNLLEAAANALAAQQVAEAAARLFGASHAGQHAHRFRRPPFQHQQRQHFLDQTRAQLGEPAFAAAFAAGQAMTLDQAVDYALALEAGQ